MAKEIKTVVTIGDLIALGEGAIGVTKGGKFYKYDFKNKCKVEVAPPIELDEDLDEELEPEEVVEIVAEEEKTVVVEESKVEPEIKPETPKTVRTEPSFKSPRDRLLSEGNTPHPKAVVVEPTPVVVEEEPVETVEEITTPVEDEPETVADEPTPADVVAEEPKDTIELVTADLEAIVARIKNLI